MQKKILSLIVILVLLVSVSAVFGFFHNSVTGNSIFGRLFSKNIKPSAELQPGVASQITNFCYGREITLNTGEPYGVNGKVIDASLELLAVDANEGLFKRGSSTISIDEGRNYRFNYGDQFDLEIYVKDITETTDGQSSGVVILCGIACPGSQYNLQTGQNILVSGKTVTFVAVDKDEVLINVDGQSKSIDEHKLDTVNGVKIYVDSAIETSNDQGIGVFTFCDVTGAGVSTFSSTKTPTQPTTIKPTTDLKPGTLSTFTSDPQRCVVWPYPTTYNEKTGNVLCSGVGNRECVTVVDYTGVGSITMDKIIGVRDCRDLVSSGEGIQRIAVCCRFN